MGRIDPERLDSTTEADLARQATADEAEARQEAAKLMLRPRKRLGLKQAEFAARIELPLETIRNWEQGRRYPPGAAKSLVKVLEKAPELALAALH